MTAAEVKAKMIALHRELGNFLFYLTMNSGTIPPHPNEDDENAINHVMERIEAEVKRVAVVERRNTLDDIVHTSLEQAGFKPDQTPPGDSK